MASLFEKLATIASARGIWPHVEAMAGIYYDDPNHVAEADLRCHAGLMMKNGAKIPEGLEEIVLASGKYAIVQHKGTYATLKKHL